ncbi:MAG: hypothetical protein E6I99_10830 [Chloroflexi bacterium]|nr:MAG: hypothetical protein E6I99_10830 [Chloroflexota bacterium]
MQTARGGLVVVTVLIAGLLAAGYTAYAGAGVYQSLESGRQELVAAQASMKAAAQSADPGPLSAAAAQLKHAELDFRDADRRSRNDPVLRLLGGVPAALKQKYAGRHLTVDDLQAALEEAQTIARTYSASTRAIGEQLRAAHAEREQVTTTALVPPLRDAYDQVDRALAEADNAFLRYQDVRQVLSDFLGVRLPA